MRPRNQFVNNRFFWTFASASALLLGIAGACTAGGGSTLTDNGAGAANSGNSGNGGSGGLSIAVGTAGNTGVGGGCASETIDGDNLPLDMYIMLDQSGSMSSNNKWDNVTAAINNFMALPDSDGIGVGIQYFPAGPSCPQNCTTNADCGAGCGTCLVIGPLGVCTGPPGGDSCDVNDYATPEVPIDVLPGVAGAITASMASHGPTGGTPTGPAVTGGIQYARAHAAANPDHVTVLVLATDGQPQACSPQDIPDIAQIAADGVAGDPSILTFVIGVGNELSNLNALAVGGGTSQAYIVDSGNMAEQQFLAALEAIKGTALGCVYGIPEPTMGELDYGLVNVEFTPGPGEPPINIPYVGDAASCPANGLGWHYDNAADPTQIILCPSTCDQVGGSEDGEIKIVLGCITVVP